MDRRNSLLRLLDLYSGAGGAGMGYHRAGFEVVGVDIAPQKNYPFQFVQADALEYLADHWEEFDAIHASPPCQAFTKARVVRPENEHPNLIPATREALEATGLPYIIENVKGAPLINTVTLCGAMFPGLRVYRHRLFEANFPLTTPAHPVHLAKITKMGRLPAEGEFMHVVGNFNGVAAARQAMGIDWMLRVELREAIPPAYTECLGEQLRRHIANS